MKKIRHFLIVSGAILLAPAPANASTAQMGNISGLYAGQNGAVLFNTDGSRTTPPACGSANPTRWAIDASTVAGQGMIAIMLNAYNRGKQLFVAGTGTCSIWGDTESISFIASQD